MRSLRPVECCSRKLAEEFRDEASYFDKNAKRMCYPEFRRQHLSVSSGVIEAGCKPLDERILVGAGNNHSYPASRFVLTYLFDDSPTWSAGQRPVRDLRASAWR